MRFKIELEEMVMIEGRAPCHSQEFKGQALGLRPQPFSGFAR
jgi:hypothetical protein